MGELYQLQYAERYIDEIFGPYLEVGSKDYGNTQNVRSLLKNKSEKYTGVDIIDGKNVDVILDLSTDFNIIDQKLNGMRFGTIFCFSVLEHCAQPFALADNLTRLLKDKGTILISAPFAWKYHAYPSDYWRFTHSGIMKLFPNISFELDKCYSMNPASNEFLSLDEKLGLLNFSFSDYLSNGNIIRAISSKTI